MSLVIESPETDTLISKLAELTGENQTTAVTIAVQERLERLGWNERRGLSERLMAIAKECGPLFKEPWRSMEHGDILYDENGLPK